MPDIRLSVPARAALFVLMTYPEGAVNTTLFEECGLRIDKPTRERLLELGYIECTKIGRATSHKLTSLGWKGARDQLCVPFAGAQKPYRVLGRLLTVLDNSIDRLELTLSDLFIDKGVPARVISTYTELVTDLGDWLPLRTLRAELADLPEDDIDEALVRLARTHQIQLIAEANQKTLTAEDWDAAVVVGTEQKHLMSVIAS